MVSKPTNTTSHQQSRQSSLQLFMLHNLRELSCRHYSQSYSLMTCTHVHDSLDWHLLSTCQLSYSKPLLPEVALGLQPPLTTVLFLLFSLTHYRVNDDASQGFVHRDAVSACMAYMYDTCVHAAILACMHCRYMHGEPLFDTLSTKCMSRPAAVFRGIHVCVMRDCLELVST